MKINYRELCLHAVISARTTGAFIREARLNHEPEIHEKGKNDFVTKYDQEAEKRIVADLSAVLPEAGFITEEETISKKSERFNWVIDPIDGTTNFIHGLYPFSISIALKEYDEIVLGVIYEIGLDECFYSWKDGPALMNEKEIHVSSNENISDSLIATGFPYTNFDLIDSFIESLHYFMRNSHGMRRMGSAAVDLAYVACGRFDAFYEYNLNDWDIAAGLFLVKQAGGKVSDFSGEENYFEKREIIASNTLVFNEFFKKVSFYLKQK